MNEFSAILLWALLRAGVMLTALAVVISIFLRVFNIASPTIRRVVYFAVILQGCLVLRWSIVLPLPTSLSAAIKPAADPPPIPVGADVIPSGANKAVGPAETAFVAEAAVVRSTRGSSPAQSTFPWAFGLAVLWAAGIVALLCRSVWAYARFVRELPPSQNLEGEWGAEWEALQQQAGIRSPALLHAAERTGPVLCRLPRGYRLIVPAIAWQTLESAQRLLVLRHELAHIQRHDVWKSLSIRVLALPHWFNPLVWWIVRRFDECAEFACDDAARKSPEDLSKYARALLQLGHRAEPIFFATRAANDRGLSYRIRRLLNPHQEKNSKMKTAAIATLVLGFSLLNVLRLQTRADDRSQTAFSDTVIQSIAEAPNPVGVAPQKQADISSPTSSRQAIVDLRYVLLNVKEFRQDQQKLKLDVEECKRFRGEQEDAIRAAQKRADEEKDPLLQELLTKGIAQKKLEMNAARNENCRKLAERQNEIYGKAYDKVCAEISRYAKEHNILVVRRVDLYADRGDRVSILRALDPSAVASPYPASAQPFPAHATRLKPRNQPSNAHASAFQPAAAYTWAANAALFRPERFSQEVVYVNRDSGEELDISDEILKELNSAK